MKKLVPSIFLLLAVVTGKVSAQLKDNLSFGPVIGFGHSTISGNIDDEAQKKFHPSYNIGLRLVYSIHPQWGFGSDISFRTEGAKVISSTTFEEDRLGSFYIRFDPKAYYFFGEQGKAFRPKISFGPSFGFLAGGRLRHYEGNTFSYEFDADEIIKKFDLGLAGALGFNYRIKSGMWLNIDAAYNHGLLNIIKENTDEPIYNRSLFLNAGLLFGIGSANLK